MRNELRQVLLDRAASEPEFMMLTGDLGFNFLEPVAEALGHRFINAGIAEQNMVSVAAALAREGFAPWVYSIAPFVFARPFEQVRNDICFNGLKVVLVGNGGGYGYGVMGPSHHAIEDYGVLLTLPSMKVIAPAFSEDLGSKKWADTPGAKYLRLGRDEKPKGFEPPAYAPWRQLTTGGGGVVIAVGALASAYVGPFHELPEADRPELWALTELPIPEIPDALDQACRRANTRIVIAEEHVARGSAGMEIASKVQMERRNWAPIVSCTARVVEGYGSQTWLRQQVGLDATAILRKLRAE
jgi:transketolase